MSSTVTPEPLSSAPTPGDVMNALRIRDEIAYKISRVRSASPGEKVPMDHARAVAERLIELGYIETAKVHAYISDAGDYDFLDEDDEELDE